MPSFNSSGRSSNCDEGDMQSDISLEEDVNDLNHKVIFILSKFRWSTYVLVYVLQLAPGSRDLPQAEEKITVV